MDVSAPQELISYYSSGKPLVCELDADPYLCEFWPLGELATYNQEYEVAKYAPGFFGFATSGGGYKLAISPSGSVVHLLFIGMAPSAALTLTPTWGAFEAKLRGAL